MPAVFNTILISLALGSPGTDFVSPNFIVHAPTAEIAQQVAAAAEDSRRKLAVQWYGHEISNWGSRCDVTVVVGRNLGAGGATRFKFDRGEVYDWKMEVQGSLERILDSVIPHEVNHTILACYFRRKVPRWADEGAATVVEHISEKSRSFDLAEKLVNQGRRIPLRVLLDMTQYPRDTDQVLAMYAQGYSLTEFLIQQSGRQHFLKFLNDAHYQGWDRAIVTFYGCQGIEQLEQKWSSWVLAGSPGLNLPQGQLLADTGPVRPSQIGSVIRSQGPEAESPQKLATRPETINPPTSLEVSAELLSEVDQFTRNLNAPDPRARTVTAKPGVFELVDVSLPARQHTVPKARVLTARNIQSADRQTSLFAPADTPLQPLVLTRIADRSSISSPQTTPSMPHSFPDHSAAIDREQTDQSPLRETRLRTVEAPTKTTNRFLNWSQFPSRFR
ncbi:MAG: hypothetical protein O3B13_08230 [Planctomycetota bacterium]|nr:hypothetical protein [Planctomycetota bacterium]